MIKRVYSIIYLKFSSTTKEKIKSIIIKNFIYGTEENLKLKGHIKTQTSTTNAISNSCPS